MSGSTFLAELGAVVLHGRGQRPFPAIPVPPVNRSYRTKGEHNQNGLPSPPALPGASGPVAPKRLRRNFLYLPHISGRPGYKRYGPCQVFSPVSLSVKVMSRVQPRASAISRSSRSEKLSRFILPLKLAGLCPNRRASSASVMLPCFTMTIRMVRANPMEIKIPHRARARQ